MAQDPYRYFRIEARELVEQLGQGVLSLEKGEEIAPTISRLLRLAHTLKGAARVVKHGRIAELAHAVEDVLGPLREDPKPLLRVQVEVLLANIDGIGREVDALSMAPAVDSVLRAKDEGPRQARPDEPFRTLKTDVGDVDELLDGLSEAAVSVAGFRDAVSAVARMRGLADLLHKQLAAPARTDRASALSLADQIERAASGLERELAGGADRAMREMKQVRSVAERLRLLPAGALFVSLERVVRDAARATGREVHFSGRGHDVRIDSHVLGEVQGALVQLVRNAVAHGIEPAKDRIAAGKAAAGLVEVVISRSGGRVVFVCRDDGAGVDTEAVLRVARAKGMRPPGEAREEDVLALLLRGGITTSGTVTELSGRGVGLEVVQEIAARLGAELVACSRRGRGTEVELRVKSSLSSMAALLVEASGETLAIPLDVVRATIRIKRDQVLRTSGAESIAHDGTVVPFVMLERVLGRRSGEAASRRALSAVVVEANGSAVALGVNRLAGTEVVVIRPLDARIEIDPVVAGVAMDEEGNPRLVLDADALAVRASRCAPEERGDVSERAPILVVDDSLTTRMLEKSILESAGYEVELAVSGEEGLEKARMRRFALFLVDVEMPGMDGFTFVETIRADPHFREIAAILITSRDSLEDRRRGKAAGANDYIVKSSFDQERLLATIRRLTEKRA